MSRRTQTTFKFDEKTEETIERLKDHFGAATKAEVVRKALALLDLARKVREDGGEMAVIDANESTHKVLIS